MVDTVKLQEDFGIQRKRPRKSSFKFNKEDIANRVIKFFDTDITERQTFMDDRLQRYAKYRMWTERNSLPWEDASDIALPDMTSDSLRLQDTLHNSIMSFDLPISSKASNKEEAEKEATVDNLIKHQLFLDMNGEGMVGDLAETFVNDGVFTVFIPWIREDREVSDERIHPPIPNDAIPKDYFAQIIQLEFPNALDIKEGKGSWDWTVRTKEDEENKVSFYTTPDEKVQMTILKTARVFDGPRPMVKDIDEVLHPWRVENLQMPSPSNPGGSSHVILIDYPSIDELKRLKKSGFYDQITDEELKVLENTPQDRDNQEMKDQKDDFQGTSTPSSKSGEAVSHRTLTRLMCFDTFDIDGDGLDEDVIWWVIKETKTVLKAKILTEMYPSNPPRRPFAEASLIPVKGRRLGISYLELIEGLHDVKKETLDQMADAGTITNSPFFFYKSTSLQKPEILTLAPGDGYPLADPKNDVQFPNIQNNSQSFGMNMITLLTQMEERLTMIGDLQAGRIPAGKSSALRTQGGINALLGQAEARPERILRRFFNGFTEIWYQVHELNQRFLPKKKQIQITANLKQGEDPYQEVTDASEIQGRFRFKFSANVLNVSKANIQAAMSNIMAVTVSEIMIQLGISTPDTIFRQVSKFIEAWGQDPNTMINPPTPQADSQRIQAEEAIISIMNGVMPSGVPVEGFIEHLGKLQVFMQSEQFVFLEGESIRIFNIYLEHIAQGAQQEAAQQQLVEAARNFQAASQGGGQGGEAPSMGNPQLNDNELIDRTLTNG